MLEQEQKSKKKEIISFLHEQISSPTVRNMLLLCDILIDEARTRNDEAGGADFIVNQGMVKAFKELQYVINKVTPEEHKGRMCIDS